jgi:hypothetical protein
MRRAQAILVIIVLLTAPLSLLAASSSSDMPSCDGMCCLPHHGPHNSGAQRPVPQKHNRDGEACEHGSAGNVPKCMVGCGHAQDDFSFVAPTNPTKPSSVASLSRFDAPQSAALPLLRQRLAEGCLAVPFQPPRA